MTMLGFFVTVLVAAPKSGSKTHLIQTLQSELKLIWHPGCWTSNVFSIYCEVRTED